MVTSIVDVVRQFKQGWSEQLGDAMIEKACRDVGHRWTERVLGPVMTLRVFMLQVLNGNTAMAHLPRLARMTFTAGAYCQARFRVPLAVFRLLLRRVACGLESETLDDGRWLGHRVFFVDGSSFSMPDTKPLHPSLQEGDVLVADRGFCSYAHLALLFTAHRHAVFRIHQRQIVDFTPQRPHSRPGKKRKKGLPTSRWIRGLPGQDQLVEWFKPKDRPKWIRAEQYAALPDSLIVRELRSETVDGVLKELHMFCLIYNLVRLVMLQASQRQGVPPDRISFIDALRWLATARPDDRLPRLVVNTHRPNRLEPRVRKRRPKEYPLMKQPRKKLRKALATHGDAM